MADISQTAANVVVSTPNVSQPGTSGEALTAGQPCYTAVDGLIYRAKASGTALQSGYTGSQQNIWIALNSTPGANQPVLLFRSGKINLGATLVVGESYYVSTNVGKICPSGDIGVGLYPTFLGIATTTTIMTSPPLSMYACGVVHA